MSQDVTNVLKRIKDAEIVELEAQEKLTHARKLRAEAQAMCHHPAFTVKRTQETDEYGKSIGETRQTFCAICQFVIADHG